MPVVDRPSVQAVINAMVQLFKDDSQLESLEFYQTPHYQPVTMGHPICHIFPTRRVAGEFASPKRYRYDLEAAIVIMMPQAEQNSSDRALHRYEELIEDNILRNQQIPLGNLPADVSWLQTKIDSIDYMAMEDDTLVVDSLVFSLTISYTRVVV